MGGVPVKLDISIFQCPTSKIEIFPDSVRIDDLGTLRVIVIKNIDIMAVMLYRDNRIGVLKRNDDVIEVYVASGDKKGICNAIAKAAGLTAA